VLGIDRDPKSISYLNSLKNEFDCFKDRFNILHRKFSKIAEINLLSIGEPKGILFDLGYSTAQVKAIIHNIH
jgi:16S rRNA C1402 N4-methylase RsmH